MRYRWALIAAVIAVLIAGGGVAAWQRDGESSDPAPTPSGSAASSSRTTSPSPSPPSASEREAADRAAVQAAWSRFLTAYDAVESRKYPRDQWATVVGAVAVDPTYSSVIRSAEAFQKLGLVVYGRAVSRPYWTRPVAGNSTAVMGDCVDASRTGSMYEKTGVKRTVGKPRTNTRITLVRGTDRQWRVKLIEYLVVQPC
ncbi:MAG TPA: hypothetical protein VGO94_01500 [Mycobacteriales bacterium]|jgi:hypothetical protein|nr:hypothetical protein [Mycobacteriales bacterium]